MTVKRRVIYNLNGFKVFGRFMAKIARKFVCIMLIKDTWGGNFDKQVYNKYEWIG